MSILLIRHAETAGNAERVVQTPDVPLNARGIAQAKQLAERLSEVGVELILASDHTRAAMTAKAIHHTTGAELEFDVGLQERNYGDIRGKAYRELDVDIFAEAYAPPGGETWEEFNQRVDATWERVTDRAKQLSSPLAVVTHGLFCRSLAQRRLSIPEADTSAPHSFHNTSVTWVETGPPWTVRLFNCCRHLDASSAPGPGIAGI